MCMFKNTNKYCNNPENCNGCGENSEGYKESDFRFGPEISVNPLGSPEAYQQNMKTGDQ